jgi:hypothetical protein
MFGKLKRKVSERLELLTVLRSINYRDCNFNLIEEKVDWLEQKLNIENLEIEEVKQTGEMKGCPGISVNAFLTHRQICCISLAMIRLCESKFRDAYHEICDFIENYRININDPINSAERLLLSIWIKSFKYHPDRKP